MSLLLAGSCCYTQLSVVRTTTTTTKQKLSAVFRGTLTKLTKRLLRCEPSCGSFYSWLANGLLQCWFVAESVAINLCQQIHLSCCSRFIVFRALTPAFLCFKETSSPRVENALSSSVRETVNAANKWFCQLDCKLCSGRKCHVTLRTPKCLIRIYCSRNDSKL